MKFGGQVRRAQMDNAPKLALDAYKPAVQRGRDPWGGEPWSPRDDEVVQFASQTGGGGGGESGAQPEAEAPDGGGHGMTSFEKESRAATASFIPEHQQTQAEKEMREAARNGQAPGSLPEGGQVPRQGATPVSDGKRSFLEPQPNGDLRIGDDIYLRWKPLPDIGNAALGGLIGSVVPGGGVAKFFAGYGAEQYLKDNFSYPWLTHEPGNKPAPPSDSTKDQVPNA